MTKVQEIFDKIAPVYDDLNNWLSLGQHRIWKEMTVKWCEPKLGDTALDLCCGSGDIAQILAKKVGNTGKVFGVDFAANQLAIAQKRSLSHYPPLDITWIEADVLQLPFDSDSVDCVTMGYGLRNVPDIPQSLQEIYRVLKQGRKAAILDFNHPDQAYMVTFQQWYLDHIVVPVARNFGLTEEYAYINPSLERFPKASAQIQLAKTAGFSQACHYAIAGGLMGVLVLSK